jgi:hypothetical protein
MGLWKRLGSLIAPGQKDRHPSERKPSPPESLKPAAVSPPQDLARTAAQARSPQDNPTAQQTVRGKVPPAVGKPTALSFVVGFDFGTSTIKCVVNPKEGELRKGSPFVVAIDGRAHFPSLVWVKDGQIRYGPGHDSDGQCFRSVKGCLRCAADSSEPCQKCFDGSPLSPQVAAFGMLSYAIARVKNEIEARYPPARYNYSFEDVDSVMWNMGVPLDGVGKEALRTLFLRLLCCAVRFDRSRLSDLTDLALLAEHANRACSEPLNVSEMYGFANAGNCFIFSEAHVAINAFAKQEGNLDPGVYFVCDVGAGTTDVSFFDYSAKGNPPIAFLGSSCTRVGGDDFANELANEYVARQGLTRQDALAKANNRLLTSGKDLQMRQPFAQIFKRIQEGRHRAFVKAYEKWGSMEGWRKNLQERCGGAAIGGGSLINRVQDACFAKMETGVDRDYIKPQQIRLDRPLPNGMSELHRIAFGLSFPWQEFFESWAPEFLPPDWFPSPPVPAHDTNVYIHNPYANRL